jgi:hypothetical protein
MVAGAAGLGGGLAWAAPTASERATMLHRSFDFQECRGICAGGRFVLSRFDELTLVAVRTSQSVA